MKKQIKKLNLNKRTISNLNTAEMTKIVGGVGPTKNCASKWCNSYGKCTLSCSSG